MEAGSEPVSLKIINAVFSKQNGGLEQASLDYASACMSLGHEVTVLLGLNAPFAKDAEALGCAVRRQKNKHGFLDPIAMWQLRSWLKAEKPDAIIAHGNRAISLLRKAAWGIAPVVAVNHTTSVKRSLHAKAVIVVNEELREKLLRLGHKHTEQVYVVPNMITLSDAQRAHIVSEKPHEPPVLGVLARFSPEKGLDIFLRALGELKKRDIAFKAKIGGQGVLSEALLEQTKLEGLEDEVEFMGWVSDRAAFYRSLDVFCLPSRQETFGIVMLEALQHKLPVVTTNTTGARQLSAGKEVALFVPTEDSDALAGGIERLLTNWDQARRFAEAGFDLVAEKYDIQTVAKQLQTILEHVTSKGE